jgi:hypothetical protein
VTISTVLIPNTVDRSLPCMEHREGKDLLVKIGLLQSIIIKYTPRKTFIRKWNGELLWV